MRRAPPPAVTLTTGRVAKESGVNVQTIRFYEREGLLARPARARSGYRLYAPEPARRVRFIRRAKDLGFTLEETGELLWLRVDAGRTCADVRALALARVHAVEGRDASGGAPGDERSCRVYAGGALGFSRVPPVEEIVAALANAGIAVARPGVVWWQSGLTAAPGVGAALVPTTLCPACWPALAGVLTSLGIGFVMDARWVLPATIPLLALAAGVLAFRAPVRHGYGPFALGLVAATGASAGKFVMESRTATYAGLGLLVAASIWNTWPARPRGGCGRCAQTDGGSTDGSEEKDRSVQRRLPDVR